MLLMATQCHHTDNSDVFLFRSVGNPGMKSKKNIECIVCVYQGKDTFVIMAYGSTPYEGMTSKKMAATLKVHK